MKIILIGNGFDLAHGKKTSYNDFIQHVKLTHDSSQESNPYTHLFLGNSKYHSSTELERLLNSDYGYNINKFSNRFFLEILHQTKLKNWCDIEALYFKKLNSFIRPDYIDIVPIKKFHMEFEEVKELFQSYLKKTIQRTEKIKAYSALFERFKNENFIVVNFNYTDTISEYIDFKKKGYPELYNLHGQLGSVDNPIVFGYAASEQQINELVKHDNQELIKHIKRFNYKVADVYDNLLKEISIPGRHELWVLGHSFGISDHLIMSQLINASTIHKIRVFYYENYKDFKDKEFNMSRISGDTGSFNKLVNFKDSFLMPQLSDDKNQTASFIKCINELLSLRHSIV